jgi:hypothetical protein
MVLLNVSDDITLNSLLHALPSFHVVYMSQDKKTLISKLKRDLGSQLLVDAQSSYGSGGFQRRQQGSIKHKDQRLSGSTLGMV